MLNFSYLNRQSHIEALGSKEFDLVIVGGGITGVGVARDAAMKGLSVALVEQADFSSGTSSRSSKLAHGGIRYLENFEFGLVAEALRERQNLLRMAPHMVSPLPFLIPIYKGDRVGRFKMKMGMILYDLLSVFRSPKFHRSISAAKIKEHYKALKSQGLKGGFVYYDANMEDDRLVLETAKSAVFHGAHLASYVSAGKHNKSEGGVVLDCVDLKKQKSFKIRAKHMICCAGPWTDEVALNVDASWSPRMRPSKGVHITLPKSKLNLKTAIVMAADKEKRILFCIPREDFDIVGTTDTDFKADPSSVRANKEDVTYILKVLKDYFPNLEVGQEEILSTYAGVRPLVNDGSASESKVSRDHWIYTDKKNAVTYISGGKYTTYLSMAEHCVEEAVKSSKLLNTKLVKANTRVDLVDEGVESLSEKDLANFTEEEIKKFRKRHGKRANAFFKRYKTAKSIFELEIYTAIYEYNCGALSDFYFRRVPYVLSGQFLSEEDKANAARLFAEDLGWSEAEKETQIANLNLDLKTSNLWKA